jgi:hypothetical protein
MHPFEPFGNLRVKYLRVNLRHRPADEKFLEGTSHQNKKTSRNTLYFQNRNSGIGQQN